MESAPKSSLRPRKTPVQARSSATVEVIFEAAIRIFLEHGYERLTTTRVAERAGVSVGSLYQYFPNKGALTAAILERYLNDITSSVERACLSHHGRTVREMVTATCGAFVDAKIRRLDISMALYRLPIELGGQQIVRSATVRSQAAMIAMLKTASDRVFADLSLPSMILTTAIIGPVRAMIESGASTAMFGPLKSQLIELYVGYLNQVSIPEV